jgi:hypothetical protein
MSAPTRLLYVFPDAEDIAKEWLTGSSVAPLVLKNGKPMIFQAMPKGAPIPVIVLIRVGGAPGPQDVPYDQARISFTIWATSRIQCKAIKLALVSELQSLTLNAPVDTSVGRLESATVINDVFLPDPASDTPRYVVDALLSVRSV